LVEQEIKLAVTDPERFEAIAAAEEISSRTQGEERFVSMDAAYIDTAGLGLMRAGYAFRVRWEGDHWVATVKRAVSDAGADGYHRHQEWEAPVAGPEPDLSVFEDTELQAGLSAAAGEEPLRTLFQVRVERRVRKLLLEGGTRWNGRPTAARSYPETSTRRCVRWSWNSRRERTRPCWPWPRHWRRATP